MPIPDPASAPWAKQSALAGIRVLDLTRMLAGPLCTALLADIGAEVIKIENPAGGDDARGFEPRSGGESAYFMLLNRGKKSMTLDLKSAEGLALVRHLVAQSDVVVENFRPGTAARLGIDYEALRGVNPRLIYASISGFGQDGPLSHRAAYDIIAQAMSGLMSITGWPDGPPTRIGESFGDIVAGIFASWGILAALEARHRTGMGQHLDIAMLDSMFSVLVTPLCRYLYAGTVPERIGNRHPVSTPFDSYRARDGLVVIAIANDRLFAHFAETIGLPELPRDARFSSDALRTENEAALRSLIEGWTADRTVEDIVTALEAAGVPVSPIWSIPEAVHSDHVRERGLITTLLHPTAGPVQLLSQPVKFSATPGGIPRPPPLLGEHTDVLLQEILGLDEAARTGLRDRKTV